ncbi:MAG: PD-(D/E)XK nuclease family protein, partial [Bacteroidales bacterium]|nr:PD-(D/E)XK nuclease family protein [Bacteroidales bacterium]
ESGKWKVESKSEALMEHLRAMADRGFTPTGFEDYLECPLRYSYTKVLRISKEEDLDNDLDASQLGTCIHNVLEKIYAPYVGRNVDANGLKQALADLPQLMEAEFREYYLHGRDTEGRNRFYHSVAETQLRNLLKKEVALLEQGHTLEMVAVEQMIEPPYLLGQTPDGAPIRLRGKVDRIDRLDGRLRVIDYKTGHLEDKEITYSSTPNRNGEVVVPGKWFQLMCYALLYARSLPATGHQLPAISAGIYPLRHLQSDVRLASWDGTVDITPAMLDDFEGLLRDLCLELLNPDIPFRAATRKEACRYCDVHSFCPLRP